MKCGVTRPNTIQRLKDLMNNKGQIHEEGKF